MNLFDNNDKIDLKKIVLADMKYFNSETNKFDNWSIPKISAILMVDENSHFINMLDFEDDIPIIELYSSRLKKDDICNIRLLQGEKLESGACYLIRREDLSSYFHGKDVVSYGELENFILSRNFYIKGRKKLVIKRLKEDPLKALDVLISDSRKEKKLNKFLSDADNKVYKK